MYKSIVHRDINLFNVLPSKLKEDIMDCPMTGMFFLFSWCVARIFDRTAALNEDPEDTNRAPTIEPAPMAVCDILKLL